MHLFVTVVLSVFLVEPTRAIKADICWIKSYGRGVGKVPSSCAAENDAGLCYKDCDKSDHNGVGPVCWEPCPEGYKEVWATCNKDWHVYWKTAGCTSACLPRYDNHGCTCSRAPHIFARKSYGRGAGKIPECSKDQEYDAGLCYTPCKKGFKGVGPVCWQVEANPAYPHKCNELTYGKTQKDCDEVVEMFLKNVFLHGTACVIAVSLSVAGTIATGGSAVGAIAWPAGQCAKAVEELLKVLEKQKLCFA